jgi:hypothetical protein
MSTAAALERIVEALRDGDAEYALMIALSALEDASGEGTANTTGRPPGGWPGERWRP